MSRVFIAAPKPLAPLAGRGRGPSRQRWEGEGQQLGFALITVLWAAMILALIVESVLLTGRTEARLASNRETLAELGAIADAGLNIAMLRLLDPRLNGQPPLDGSPFGTTFAGYPLRLAVQDEAGKIDLNTAQDELLRGLLRSAGADPETASALKDCILDWREPGIGKRLNGAKAPEYRAAGLAYGPRNGPFATVEEVQLVMGMTPELFAAIQPALTVYSQSPLVDPSFAPTAVLRALPGIDEAAIATLLQTRAAGKARNHARPRLHDHRRSRRTRLPARQAQRRHPSDRPLERAVLDLPLGLIKRGPISQLNA